MVFGLFENKAKGIAKLDLDSDIKIKKAGIHADCKIWGGGHA